jgi:hypothetical protein
MTTYKAFIREHGDAIAQRLAGTWQYWRGTCCVCGGVDVAGYVDRCTGCVLASIFENEREYGGTTEEIKKYFGGRYEAAGKHARLNDRVLGEVLSSLTYILEWKTENNPELFTAE